jgi:glycyl-tRNA synthetase beta chain
MKEKDLLLEIGVEELPARFVPEALAQLSQNAGAAFATAGLDVKKISTVGTPRRLALLVDGLAEKARDRVQEALGPGMAQAKDAQGNWTPAAQGFARSQGTTPEKLEVKETDRGPRLAAVRRIEGEPTTKILPALLPELIGAFRFPKSMVWEESRTAFARPLRWLVALHGTQVVKFAFAGVKSGRKTQGLRFRDRRPLDVPSPGRYVSVLKDRLVIVDPAERRRLIEKQIAQAIRPIHGRVPLEKYGALLDEVSNLVEHPVAVLGQFDPKYLALPSEVLVTSMKKHQKFFPVFNDTVDALLPHFVGIRNGVSENQGVVREGYERVLSARLADAAFFFEQDRKFRLVNHAVGLKGIAFLSSALTMADKSSRVSSLARGLALKLSLSGDDLGNVVRIVELGKADLVTGMVGEFPELQGVMGRVYASLDGEPADVARGVEEHYWPLTADGELPGLEAAAVVSVADKIDTLAGNFLIGKVPSGSQDPYGLRRAAIGLIRILIERGWRLSLGVLVDEALGALPETLGDRSKARRALLDFLRQRWAALAESRAYRVDEIDAVSGGGVDDVVDAERRLAALRDIRRHADFAPLSVAYKRAANILAQSEKKGFSPSALGAVDATRFAVPAESALHDAVASAQRETESPLASGDYAAVLARFVALRGPVDAFFKDVIVMDPDRAVAVNRLAQLSLVVALFRRVADFGRLQDTPDGR